MEGCSIAHLPQFFSFAEKAANNAAAELSELRGEMAKALATEMLNGVKRLLELREEQGGKVATTAIEVKVRGNNGQSESTDAP